MGLSCRFFLFRIDAQLCALFPSTVERAVRIVEITPLLDKEEALNEVIRRK
jgi:hypothetical protein